MAKKKQNKKQNRSKLIWVSSIIVLVVFLSTFFIFKHNRVSSGAVIDTTNYRVLGIDISSHNGKVNFEKLKNTDVRFILIKATEGETFKDPKFEENFKQAKENDFYVGAYHFFNFDVDGVAQARNFLNSIQSKQFDMPVVIDVEQHGNTRFYMTSNVIRQLQDMIDELSVNERDVMIYTNKDGYDKFIKDNFEDYPLWLCTFAEPSDSIDWHIWQYSHWGEVEGIDGDVDLNTFYGNEEDWNEWIK